jgi:hypothetical protein
VADVIARERVGRLLETAREAVLIVDQATQRTVSADQRASELLRHDTPAKAQP